jgi:ribosomal protein S18 acetylase RimI-like enzyme
VSPRAVVERLDPRNADDVSAVAALHESLLAGSPLARMGARFLRECFYSQILADGLYDCLICRADGRIVGFLTYTDRPADFMTQGLRKHFVSIARIMVATVVLQPRQLRDLFFVARLMRDRSATPHNGALRNSAEALSLAVMEAYQELIPAGGTTRIATRLFHEMASDLRGRGASRIVLHVDPMNRAANMFYSALGCRFRSTKHAGLTRHLFEYELRPSEAVDSQHAR